MRHKKAYKKLNRTSSHRSAMSVNMLVSFFEHEIISTTLPKAKNLRPMAEKIITKAKRKMHRSLISSLKNNSATVTKLINDIAPRYQSRNGGYVRIIKNGYRVGDNAPMAVIELVDRP